MTNSLATFQTMMNNIFQDLIAEGIIVVYLDNILIFTRIEEEHTKAICHDLAKRLSHYLYFFSFLFLFLGLTTQKEVQESVTSHSHTVMVT